MDNNILLGAGFLIGWPLRPRDFDWLVTFVLGQQPWLDSATLNDPKAAPACSLATRGALVRCKVDHWAIRQASRAVVNIPAIGVQRDLFTLNLYQIRKGPVPDLFGIRKATSSPIFTLFRMPLPPK